MPVDCTTNMTQPFEELPPTPTADELLDTAFSRAARAGRAKSGIEAQQSMLMTAANVVSDNLENVVRNWPDIDAIDPFYRELAEAVVGTDSLREQLSEVGWAGTKATDIRHEYERRLRDDSDRAKMLRKQAFARLADVLREIDPALAAVADAGGELERLPDVRPDEPAIVVAGYPNVGKSSFVNRLTRASNETATYPFTTTQVHVGHVTPARIRYQLIDTPGLLDRPREDRNAIESQAVSALSHAADAVLVVLDPTGECGYPLGVQRELRDELVGRFDVPVLSVFNKRDRIDSPDQFADADHTMSVTTGTNVQAVLEAAVAAVAYDPGLPVDSRDSAGVDSQQS